MEFRVSNQPNPCPCLWTVGGSRSNRRKALRTLGEHPSSTQKDLTPQTRIWTRNLLCCCEATVLTTAPPCLTYNPKCIPADSNWVITEDMCGVIVNLICLFKDLFSMKLRERSRAQHKIDIKTRHVCCCHTSSCFSVITKVPKGSLCFSFTTTPTRLTCFC